MRAHNFYSPPIVPGENVDPAFRLLLEEKEQALLALQETVEVRGFCFVLFVVVVVILKKTLYNTVALFCFNSL